MMKIQSAELLEYGIFKNNQPSTEQEVDENSPSGYFLWTDELVLELQTNRILIREGMRVGIKYILHGRKPGKMVSYTCRIQHPEMISPLNQQPYTEILDHRHEPLEEELFDFFEFDDEDIPVARGEWIFQILEKERVLLEQRFELR